MNEVITQDLMVESERIKILVVDDTKLNRVLLTEYLKKLGQTVVVAENGLQAIEVFEKENPDLVIMDVMMPEMDGYEATRRIKALCGDRWVPIIFMSALTSVEEQTKGLDSGGDDYLTKPVNFTILTSKIRVMLRIANMQKKLTDSLGRLEEYQRTTEQELNLAKYVMSSLIRTDLIDKETTRQSIMPTSLFSGDIIAAARTPAGALHVILADVTGHGLSAALSAIPVVEVFYTMTAKNYPISSICRELNMKLKQVMPTEHFVAAAMVAVNETERTITVWNGGAPKVVFVGDDGNTLKTWDSAHIALGIIGDSLFDASVETWQWQEPGQVYLFSDGLIEAENAAGEAYGLERLLDVLQTTPSEQRFDAALEDVKTFLGDVHAHDDVSLTAITCRARTVQYDTNEPTKRKKSKQPQAPQQWQLNLALEAADLKSYDAMPLLITWLGQMQLSRKQMGEIFLILTELFNNALDHGILHLDSAIKAQEDGFDRYLQLRSERLNELEQGDIFIQLHRISDAEHGECLDIILADSGSGFDYQAVIDKAQTPLEASNNHLSGRGIPLVTTLSQRVHYSDNGRRVEVRYRLV